MAMAKTVHDSSTSVTLLEELKAAAEKLGIRVREERLLREVGYRVRSGSCRLRDTEVIFLDRGLPASAQVDVLVEELANRPLDTIYLSPAARALIERGAANRALPHADREAVGG
ncbi:MAG: hypothetical protein H6Q33_5491 [Deltaproteobacteria bacterium]|nr:hypothetical protein [Deltaproteobacteria bacterium]